MRDVKELARLTNAGIAQAADVSIGTIERIMAISIDQDIRRATARRIEQVIIGPIAKYFCDLDYDDSVATERIAQLLAQNEQLQKDNERYKKIIDKYLIT
jgi:hypothetical protein